MSISRQTCGQEEDKIAEETPRLRDFGEDNFLFSFFRAITKRKRAGEALRELEGKWRLLAENIPDVILTAGKDGRIQFLNHTVARFAPEHAIGTTIYEYVPPDQHHIMRKSIERVFQTGRIDRYEIDGVGEHGPNTKWETRVVPIMCDGQVVAVNLISTDITKRKKTEEQLRESEEKYRSVVENIGIGVSIISPKMEILALNRQLRESFPDIDVSKKPICYRAFNKPPRENMCSYCPTYKSLKDGQVHEAITETPAGDKILNYRIISSPVKDKDGRVVAAIEMVEDITERKKTEEALHKERDRAEKYLNIAGVMLLVVDADETVTLINRRGCEILGYSEDEIVGRNWFDTFIAEPIREEVRGVFKKLMAGELEPVELNIMRIRL